MKEKNYIQEFDDLFKQQLENASTPVPQGVWESVSSSIGSGATVATAAVKTAIWMKAAIAASIIGVVSVVSYQVFKTDTVVPAKPLNTEKAPETFKAEDTEKLAQNDVPSAGPVKESGEKHIEIMVSRGVPLEEPPMIPNTFDSPADTYTAEGTFDSETTREYLEKVKNEQAKPDTAQVAASDEEKAESPFVKELPAVKAPDSSYIYVPNVVTPNGDGVNDEYLIDIKGEEFVQIIIYSVKNVKLFETRNKLFSWDCKLPNGEMAPEGTYIVKVIYKFKNKEKTSTTTKLTLIK